MSQIGYMMLGGRPRASPAIPFAIFHLLTHGFFKANMFLGAGSVMHGMDDDVDMRHYGALRKAMPVTFLTFAMGYLAIIGFPRLLRLLVEGQDHRGRPHPELVRRRAGHDRRRGHRLLHDPADVHDVLHQEAVGGRRPPARVAAVMTVPLMVLAALSVLGGLMLVGDWIVELPRARDRHRARGEPAHPGAGDLGDRASLIVAVGVAAAWYFVGQQRGAPRGTAGRVLRRPGRPRRALRQRDQRRPGRSVPAASWSPA